MITSVRFSKIYIGVYRSVFFKGVFGRKGEAAVKADVINNELVIQLDERIDYSNATQVEEEILEIVKQHEELPLCLDAEKLTYISSAGLRIILKLKKSNLPGFSIRNVSAQVYEIFEMTQLNTILDIQRKQRVISIEGCEEIGSGAAGTVYRLDEETAVKVYHGGPDTLPKIEAEQKKARQALFCGVPTAIPFDIVRVGDSYGAVYEMINAHTLNDIVQKEPERLPEVIEQYAGFILKLHSIEVHEGQFPEARYIFVNNLEEFSNWLSPEVVAALRVLLKAMPATRHLIHGDIQMKNVMLSGDEMILIDMDHLSFGDPVFEFASLYASYIVYNEVSPLNSDLFFGLDRNVSMQIFHGTLREYLKRFKAQCSPEESCGLSEKEYEEAELKAKILGYLRFLAILTIEKKEEQSDLKERGIRHAVDRLRELVFKAAELVLIKG